MKKIRNLSAVFAVPATVFLILCIFIDNYSIATLKITLIQSIIPTIIGYAICFVYTTGMFDLSCGSAIIMIAMLGGGIGMKFGLVGIIVGNIVFGVLMGMLNGSIYTILRIPCLIVSLGLLLIYEILAMKLGFGIAVQVPKELTFIGKTPYNIVILVLSGILFYFLYNRTRISCHIRAVGSDELLVGSMGVSVKKTKFFSFVLAGIFLGIAALLQLTYAGCITTVSSLTSISMIFQPLMCVIVAEAMKSFCNETIGIFVSQFTITLLFNAIIALGLPNVMKNVVLGVMLIIVMGFAINKEQINEYFRKRQKKYVCE